MNDITYGATFHRERIARKREERNDKIGMIIVGILIFLSTFGEIAL